MKRKVIAGILIVVGLAVMSVPLYFKITGSQKNDEMITLNRILYVNAQ